MKHQSIAAEHDGAGTDSREPDGQSIRCRGVPLAAAHSAGGCRMIRENHPRSAAPSPPVQLR